MIDKLITKIRSAIRDASKTSFQTYTASGRVFEIAQENVLSITSITVNGNPLTAEDYSYVSQEVTIDEEKVSTKDVVIISFTYTRYSDTELIDYIRTALMFLDTNNYYPHFDIESGDETISPTPEPEQENLIAIICSILINPDYSEYRTATVTIRYPMTLVKDEKIAKIISKFKRSAEGITDVISFEGLD